MKLSRRTTEPTVIALIEESVHLLRRAPAALLLSYYAGAVPFVLGLLFFWAYTTWFRPPGAVVAWGAFGLVGLFAAMKAAQAEFCAGLLRLRLGAAPAAWSWARFGRLVLAQARLQPWVLLALPPVMLLSVPFGWVWAYGQSATVIGEGEHLPAAAVAQAKLWPAQNHLGLLVLSVLAFCTWLNLATAFYLVPWLANRLLGIENIFGFSGWWFLNTTFLASVTALTWLAIDPLIKAFYTLRVFHGRSRRTGEDVRVELQRTRGAGALRAMATLVWLLAFVPVGSLRAVEPVAVPAVVQSAQLDRAIDDVLSGSNFRWRLRPPAAEVAKEADGPIRAFFRLAVEKLRDLWRYVTRFWRMLTDWYDRHFSSHVREDTAKPAGASGLSQVLLRGLLYIFIGVAVVLIVWLVWLVWRQARRNALPVLKARAVAATVPDLRDENVQAALLPVDGWLALAREQAARGEWRLALRALYLATLAQLAAESLITLAAFKTNLDYERELRRRALSRTELVGRFVTRRREFESVWYGRVEPGAAEINDWLTELERPVVR